MHHSGIPGFARSQYAHLRSWMMTAAFHQSAAAGAHWTFDTRRVLTNRRACVVLAPRRSSESTPRLAHNESCALRKGLLDRPPSSSKRRRLCPDSESIRTSRNCALENSAALIHKPPEFFHLGDALQRLPESLRHPANREPVCTLRVSNHVERFRVSVVCFGTLLLPNQKCIRR